MTRISFFVLILSFISLRAQEPVQPPFPSHGREWVDSVYHSLTLRERIGQLIMVAGFSNKGPEHQASIERLIRDFGIGGIAFFQGGPVRQAKLVNRYQSISKVPLLMSTDAEWGLAMRLDSTPRFPYQMALGAIGNDELIYRMGAEIARELREVGIQMNFAPVADVNNNPGNPVINYRSFGEVPDRVAAKALSFMKGLQDMQVLATAKHFPGHGDTDTDSHLALPQIGHSRERLDTVELLPFRRLIASGLRSMMIAHLDVPALENEKGTPATLSKVVVTDLLRRQMNFNGLVVTDALNMKGVTSVVPPGEIEIKALLAGSDLLVYVEDVELAVRAIESAVNLGIINRDDIERSCKAVLAAKCWAGLPDFTPLELEGLHERLNRPEADLINRELVAASITVLENRGEIIPFLNLDTLRIASVSIGTTIENTFRKRLNNYQRMNQFNISQSALKGDFDALTGILKPYNLIILSIHDMDMRASRNYGLSSGELAFIDSISRLVPTVAVVFGNPYSLGLLRDPKQLSGLIMAYQESELTMDLAAQLLFGGIGSQGRLPVSAAPFYKAGDGLDTRAGIRLSYTIPEALNIDSRDIRQKIDSICFTGIREGAFPGCEVLAAREGQVFFHECYGNHTYEELKPVTENDLFDMASVTKVSAALPAIMKLYQKKIIRLDVPFSRYWTDFRGTDKKNMTVRQVLAHCSGLPAWIPFWMDTKNPDSTYKRNTLRADSTEMFPVRVSAGLWRHKTYDRDVYEAIRKAPVLKERKYIYSDLGFHIWPRIIERQTGRKYEEFLANEFYRPLGASTLTYNPLRYFPPERIIPTERDTFFRMELLHGYVHDEGAAMLGGVSGNAGLFGTAGDLAKLFQMYLWKGSYGGRQLLDPAVVNEFTRRQFASGFRRGLGFDKPLPGNDTLSFEDSYPCPSASPESFGHSGYTGTFVWADPSNGLLYIFLSNRVYPTRNNTKLTDLYIRKSILQTLYDAINQ